MNLFSHFEPGLCVRLMTTLLHFFWQGTIVALLAVFAVALLRPTSSRVRYGVYVMALLLMAVCPVVTFWVAGNRPTPRLPEIAASVSSDAAPVQPALHETKGTMPLRTSGPQVEAPEASRPVASSLRPRLVRTKARLTFHWKRYAPHAAACYLVGVVVMLGRLLLALQGGKRLRRRAQPVDDPALLALVAYWAKALRLSFRPVIAYCRRVAVPTVVGVLRPAILLPLSATSGLSPEQAEMLLLHELAHIRRCDHLVNVAQGLIEAFLFFHPAVWFVSRRIRIERENCCDDVVVAVGGEPVAYAASLVEMAALSRLPDACRLANATLRAGRRPSQLGRRVHRLLRLPVHEPVRLTRSWGLALAIAGVIALGAAASLRSERNAARGKRASEEPRFATQSQGRDSADQKKEEERAKVNLAVRVVDGKGRPAGLVLIQLWRRQGADEESGWNRSAWPERIVWQDEASGKTWLPDGLHQTRDSTVFEKLLPGEYRVSVARVGEGRGADPSPVGVSEVIRLSADEKRVEVTVRLEGETPLTLKFFDAKDEKPLENAHFVLFRSDGFPVGHGRTFSGDDGTFQFGGLRPGTYSLTAGKRAWQYGQREYEVSDGHMRVEVVGGRNNIFEVPLEPVELTQAEVEARWPFVVTGTVTEGEKQPMAGVEVRVNCGMGTLWETGKTISGPDGKYMLRFGAAMTSLDEQSGQWVISWQFATVRAYKSGYYEKNLSRHGGLSIAGEARFIPEPPREPVVLPNKPYPLDFVMLPAATINGRLVDAKGRPVASQRLWLSGKEMPPSQNVLAGATTDNDGRFTIGDVPCKSWWFSLQNAKGRELKTAPITISVPAAYEIELTYDSPLVGQPSLTCKVIAVGETPEPRERGSSPSENSDGF